MEYMNENDNQLPPVVPSASGPSVAPGISSQPPAPQGDAGFVSTMPPIAQGPNLPVPAAEDAIAPVPGGLPEVADDADLIEKEWVEKAKQILAETHDNPYVMSQQLTAMKTDYLKKRYGKDVKAE